MKSKKNKMNYEKGGPLDMLNSISGLTSMIPGGQALGAFTSGVGMVNQLADLITPAAKQPTSYNNTNSFGYETGGSMKQLNSGAMQVTGAPNVTDGNAVNYKGQDIRLDHNEIVDTDKDRVISDKYFNPYTGKKISEEVKLLEKKIGTLDKNRYDDKIADNTKKLMNKQVDGLYSIQEMVAQRAGDREGQQVQRQEMQGYSFGGKIGSFFKNLFKKKNINVTPQLPASKSSQNLTSTSLSSMLPKQTYGNVYNLNGYNTQNDTPETSVPSAVPQQMFNMANPPVNNMQRTDVNSAPQLPQSLQYKPRQGNLAANYGLYDDYMPVMPQNNTMVNGTPMQNQIQLGNQLLNASVNKTDDTPNPLDNTKKPAVKKPGFLSDGDKISLYGNLAGMVPKAIEAFGKTQVEPYRLQNTPITQQQMDSTNALYNSSKEYRDMLYNVNDTSGTLAGANSMRQAAFASKLGADNSIISQYDEKNKGLQTQYEERLAQRQGANNASMMQTDDLNSRNRGASQQMRMGVYSDIQGMAQFLGNTKNQRAKDEMMVKLRAKLSPEIMAKLAKDDPTLYEYLHGEVMPKKETKTN